MRRDHTIPEPDGCGRWTAPGRRVLVVRRISVRIGAEGIDPVGSITSFRIRSRRESPEPVSGLVQTVLDLGADVEGVIDPPALRGPAFLGDEQRHHERLEHAPAPARDDPHPAVAVVPLEDAQSEIRPVLSLRPLALLAAPSGSSVRPMRK